MSSYVASAVQMSRVLACGGACHVCADAVARRRCWTTIYIAARRPNGGLIDQTYLPLRNSQASCKNDLLLD
eukprot:6182697-Pleurochrysis_carterae.AAC.1